MKVLALDSATAACSVAAWMDGTTVAVERAELPRGQAEALLPMAERVCVAAGMTFAEFDRFAVTIGPGHFTGLRVGLAAARGLALATGRPLVGITTLEAIAAAVPDDELAGRTLAVALDSKRAESYLQTFDAARRPLAPPSAEPVTRAVDGLLARHPGGAFVVAGDAADALVTALAARGTPALRSRACPRPDAATVAALAAAAPPPAGFPAPLYVHPVETTMPGKRARANS